MDRRTAPRLTKQIPIRVGHAEFTSTNLSRSGLQFGCPSMWKLRLQPILDAGAMTATIHLPDDQEVTFDGKVVYSSAVDDEYLVGIEFTGFHGDGEATWHTFVDTYIGGD